MRVRDLGGLRYRHALGEAGDGVVAAMHFEQHRRARSDRFDIIVGMGAVGGTDFDEADSGALHDVGNAEGPADLHQLAARDYHLAPLGERIERQEHRRGVVVDHGGRLSPGELAHEFFHERIAVAPASALEVELQGGWSRHRLHHGAHRLVGEQRPAEVGVQHRSREIEDGAQPRPILRLQGFPHPGSDCLGPDRLGCERPFLSLRPQCRQMDARSGQHPRTAVRREQGGEGGRGQQPFERRDGARRNGFGTGVRRHANHSKGLALARTYPASPIKTSSVRLARSSATASTSRSFSW